MTALVKALEADKATPITPFNRILLRFPVMRATFSKIHKTFHTFDTVRCLPSEVVHGVVVAYPRADSLGAQDGSGTVEYGELRNALKALGASMTEEDLSEVFDVRTC